MARRISMGLRTTAAVRGGGPVRPWKGPRFSPAAGAVVGGGLYRGRMDLRLPAVRGLHRGAVAAVAAVLLVLAGVGTWTAVASDEAPAVHRTDEVMDMGGGV